MISGPLIYDPNEMIRYETGELKRLLPPNSEHWLGTTNVGRDVFSQVVQGTRTALIVGGLAALLVTFVGTAIGIVARYFVGKIDNILMRIVDIFYAIPFVPFVIVLVALLEPSLWNIIIVVSLLTWRTVTLNPRFTLFETIAEPLKISGIKNKDEIHHRVHQALETAELKPAEEYMYRYPHELSGGQRVAIARGIVINPRFIVADEPISMLDVSSRSRILNLLKRLRSEMGLSMLYISHDLSTIKYLCDRTFRHVFG